MKGGGYSKKLYSSLHHCGSEDRLRLRCELSIWMCVSEGGTEGGGSGSLGVAFHPPSFGHPQVPSVTRGANVMREYYYITPFGVLKKRNIKQNSRRSWRLAAAAITKKTSRSLDSLFPFPSHAKCFALRACVWESINKSKKRERGRDVGERRNNNIILAREGVCFWGSL